MDKIKIHTSIDWLTCTIPWQPVETPQETAKRILNAADTAVPIAEGKPYPFNYDKALRGAFATVSWHPDHPRMRLCYNMTGRDCYNYYDAGQDMQRLIRYHWSDLANFTRLDFAIDYFGPASIADLVDAIKTDPTCTVSRVLTPYQQITMTNTDTKEHHSGVYIGSQKSDRYICVYDKALEQNVKNTDWFRIELRTRREFANQFADAAVRNGITDTGRQIMRDYANPDIEWWRDALSGPTIDVPPVGRKDTDTRRWLIEVVAPILQAELAKVDSTEDILFKRYNEILNKARWDIANSLE